MNRKTRKYTKHSLKTEIDKSATFISLAVSGHALGATENEENRDSTEHNRQMIIDHLRKSRTVILEKTEEWIAEIDSAIEKMS